MSTLREDPAAFQRRADFLPFHRPDIGPEEIEAVTAVMQSGWLTTGPRSFEFEGAFARRVGAQHAVAVNSGTAALHLALAAVGVGPGDEVIVPTNTFTASAEVVTYLGARPVLVDIDATLNMDPACFEAAVTHRTRAVIPVHIAGQPCDMSAILDIARARAIAVVEDAAHAFPAYDAGRTIGSIGDITAFSFYATKTITTGEGGMATTDHAEYADRMRRLRLHGIGKDAWNRYTAHGSWAYDVLEAGFKYNLTDMAAAIGLAQLAKADRFARQRAAIAARYIEAFADVDALAMPEVRAGVDHAWHLFVLLLNLDRLNIDRAQFIEGLRARNIGASVHFIPLHLHPYYRETFGYRPGDFPVAEALFERSLSLPIFPGMGEGDVDDVIAAVRDIVSHHRL